MKRLFLSCAVLAALVGVRPAMAADPPRYNWSGLFVGGNVGYAWGSGTDPQISFSDPPGGNASAGFKSFFAAGGNQYQSLEPGGILGGGQIGYNYQTGKWVLGIITDFQVANIQDSASVTFTLPGYDTFTESASQKIDWFGTVRGRIGFTPGAGNWLFYASGGLAYGHVKNSLSWANITNAPPYSATGSSDTTKVGWTAGGGIEYGFGRWSAGVDYLYFDLGRSSVTAGPNPASVVDLASISADQNTAGHIVRGTLNYHFGK